MLDKQKNFKTRNNAWKCTKWRYANQFLTEDRNKYGLNNFTTEILKECDDSELDKWEKHFIDELNTLYPNGYNINPGGAGGFHCAEITKKKISIANSGENNYIYGKHLSEERKKQISEKMKGIPKSEETKKKMSENSAKYWLGKETWNKGKKMSEEYCQKVQKSTEKYKKKVYQCTLDNKLVAIYNGRNEAARKTGFRTTNIGNCCAGGYYQKGKWVNNVSYKGFRFYYEEEYKKMLEQLASQSLK